MYRWICLITVKSPNQHEPEPFRSRSQFSSRSFSVKSKVRRGLGSSPLSDYLYSPTPTHTTSPYTEFFAPPSPRPQYHDVTVTSTNSSSGSEDSSVLTSPGRISQVRRSVSTTSSVYSQMFRPDLIVLSSPLHTKHQSEQQRLTRSSSSNQTARTRNEFTKTWLEDNRHLH